MIIGENRTAVIENIRTNAQNGDFYKKVELNDPVITREQSDEIVKQFLDNRHTRKFWMKAWMARQIANVFTAVLNRDTEIIGLEKAAGITGGALITSNHFSPIENTGIRYFTRKLGKKRINIVSQITNFAMPGIIGYLMNYADTIPISEDAHYVQKEFLSVLSELVREGEFVLIYPEQEMWFNYRKPRPAKRGTYYFAARLNVPVISCFIEMQDLPEMDNEEFHKVKFIVHVLDVLYPDPEKTDRENSIEMCEKDYALKRAAYEKAYGKPLDYTFESVDIAGWTGELS